MAAFAKNDPKPQWRTLGRSSRNDLVVDLSRQVPRFDTSFQLVIHCAGRAHRVPQNEEEARRFYAVNHQGTLHLLRGLERSPALPRQLVLISTVAVYGREEGTGIDETHPLRGTTPYAHSRRLAEEAVQRWCAARNVPALILRLPLVVGPNPPGNLGAIQRAIAKGWYLRISGNHARKSMVQGADVARLILTTQERSGVYNLTDRVHPSFEALENAIAEAAGKRIRFGLPLPVAKGIAGAGSLMGNVGIPFPLTTERLAKMTATLTFDDARARRELGWRSGEVLAFIREGGLGGSGER